MRFPAKAFRGAPEAENSGLEFERGDMGMNATRRLTGFAMVATLFLMAGIGLSAFAQAPAGQDTGAAKGPKYTQAEYNAEQACAAEKNPAALLKCLDDFVSKYPNSDLLSYIYPLYYQAYSAQKNYAKMIESADKLAGLGDKVDALTRFNAYFTHATAYYAMVSDPANGPNASKDVAQAKAAQAAAASALKTLDEVKKPENVTDAVWKEQMTKSQLTLNGIAAQAAMNAKDCSGAVASYKAALALNPDDLTFNYKLGQAYLCMTPPQQMDAFWSIARAVTTKGATQAQAAKVKDYLRKLIVNYQGGNVCDNLTDAELNELLQLAGTSAERPESYKLPSSADLDAVRNGPPVMTIATVVADLKAGGDKGKLTWLAACGLDFPDVPGKLLEIVPGTDTVVLKMAFVTSQAEFDATTTPNMDVKVVGQPQAAKLEKESAPRFTGTLVSYDPDPTFFLHWEKAKVNEEDLPKEKAAPKKPPVRKPAARKPAAKP
jgi:tetratricopeptide (TPR) repeat protein